MKKFIILTLTLAVLLSSCSLFHKEPDPAELYTPTPVPTATPLPEPKVMVTEVPDPMETAEAFFPGYPIRVLDDLAGLPRILRIG